MRLYSMQKYKFYMQKCDRQGNVIDGTLKDLEVDFDGLRYSKLTGLNTLGKSQNIYTEKYSEMNGVRVYIPEATTCDSYNLTLTLYFFGENRQKVYDDFNEFIRHGYTKYWDTARNKELVFIINSEIKPSSEKWYEGTPYFGVNYTLVNINGKTNDKS